MKRLGIDLGTSSLGWAILDDEKLENGVKEGIEAGVVVFPEGMDREKSGKLISPAAERRLKRAMRRLIARRKLRKFHILNVLIAEGMCPMAQESLELWQKKKIYPVDDKAFMEWLAATKNSNPYLDRKLAAEGKVDKLTLGRAIYHIAQRRGFKSSRKEQLQELQSVEAGENKAKKDKAQEELGVVKQAIADLTERMGNQTLGQYFYTLFEKDIRIRGQKTGRIEHYEKEFARIVEVQELPEGLAQKLHDILFFQRPLRIQRHLVGWCELEKKKKYRRCLESHPLYEKYCVLSFLNNIKIKNQNDRRLTLEEHAKLYKFLHRVSPTKMADIRKQLGKDIELNYRDDVTIPILEITTRLTNLGIPEAEWQKALNALVDFQDLQRLQAWAQKTFNLSAEDARKFACLNPSTERASYSLHAIKKIIPFLEKGFLLHKALYCANLSVVIPDYNAQKEAEILDALAQHEDAHRLEKEAAEKMSANGCYPKITPIKERWETYLKGTWQVSNEAYKKLYVDITETNKEDPVLPPVKIGAIRNPLVLRALTVLRRLINTLRASGKIDANTRINIELAHSVNSANMCNAIEAYQKGLAAERETQRAELEKILAKISTSTGKKLLVNDDLLLRYSLWEEQGRTSVYTGQPISEADMVLNCDIEHTIPRSRGGTNERVNLTLCESHYNRERKKGLLPTECPNAENAWFDPETGIEYPAITQGIVFKAWQKELARLDKECAKKKPRRGGDVNAYNTARQRYLVLAMQRTYWKRKCATFTLSKERVNSSGFIPRQMVDTGTITTHAVDYLKQRYGYTYCVNGASTAFARKAWGIQAVDEKKSRVDHTHHAVDAMVIAALDHARFNTICTALKNNDQIEDDLLPKICPAPYVSFGEQVHAAQEKILVRHLVKNRSIHPVTKCAKRNKIVLASPVKKADGTWVREVPSTGSSVRGCLHNDTMYGRIIRKGEEVTVIRKEIAKFENLTKLIEAAKRAADVAVGQYLLKQIENYKIQGLKDNEILIANYYAPHRIENKNPPIMKSFRTIPIKPKNPTPLRTNSFESHLSPHQYVYSSNSDPFCLAFYKDKKGDLKPKFISLLAKLKDEKILEKIPDLVLYKGMAVLLYQDSPDELYSFSQDELSKRLYFINKYQEDGKLQLLYHREARSMTDLSKALALLGKRSDGQSTVNFLEPERLLILSCKTYLKGMLIEGRDFGFTLDGQIVWLRND